MQNNKKEKAPEEEFLGMAKKVSELVKSESDRGAILILAAYLEEILALLVRAICVSDKHGQKLTELNKPAGDFDSKIVFCVSLGLISEDEEKALRYVQKIRNRAAHFDKKGRGFDVLFDSEPTIDQVAELVKLTQSKLESRESEVVKTAFVKSCRLLATKLYVRLAKITRMPMALSSKEEAAKILERMKGTDFGEYLATMRKEAAEGNTEKLFELIDAFQSAIQNKPEGQAE